MSPLSKKTAIRIIDLLKNVKDVLFPHTCRFTPSCSVYAKQSIEKRGLFWGTAKACWRIIRCNPFNRSTVYDPVK